MDLFQQIVVTIALIFLIIFLVYIGYALHKNKFTIALLVPSIVVSLTPDESALKFTSDKIFLRDSNKILTALV